jgi:hypothetical protein
MANAYSELLTKHPALINGSENRAYLHHNMGIVMAGMIDVMSLPYFHMAELGEARALFLLGQRAGRISNVLTTFDREQGENDLTSELLARRPDESLNFKCEALKGERKALLKEIDNYNFRSFSAVEYRRGIQDLHQLHVNLKGVI